MKENISKAQLEILNVIWNHGPSTVGQIHSLILEHRDEEITRNTVQAQVTRMLRKGLLSRKSLDGNYVYRATRDKEISSGEIVQEITDRVFRGSASELIRCLFTNDRLSDGEIEEIEQLIEKLKQEQK